MYVHFKKPLLSSLLTILFSYECHAAVTQMLNSSFFSNPAELNTIKHSQFTLGSIFINPSLHYEGTAHDVTGTVSSNVYNTLPYVLTGYRVTDQWVIGLNALPSSYANLEWPMDSFVSKITTRTKALYYRFGVQSSYKLSERMFLGAGFNVEDNAQYFLNFVVPGQGNQVNSIKGVNYTGDVGVYYKINETNFLTLAGYTQVNTYGHGTSSSLTAINSNLSFNITQAPVIYMGLQHSINSAWFLEEKVYWSGWSLQQNLNFTNTTSGTHMVPTRWHDVWSFQINTRYALNKTYALLASITYDTNPVPLETNSIGYPLAAAGALSSGLDISLTNKCSIQGLYTYARFLPDSPINNLISHGVVHNNVHAGTVQITYKT